MHEEAKQQLNKRRGNSRCAHNSADLEKCILDSLSDYEVDIKDCRSQSYNASINMAGLYAELQASINNSNHSTSFVPCAAHRLNLVKASAREYCSSAVKYFITN